jgi:hypothetical protein
LRLLLDEHYSTEIAVRLRARGCDVTSSGEKGLTGADDERLLDAAAGDRRSLLTNNVRHFMPLHADWMAAGRHHYGLVFTADASMPRGRSTIGRYTDVLEALMKHQRREDALADRVHWLP